MPSQESSVNLLIIKYGNYIYISDIGEPKRSSGDC
jgi:hypothetical protein